MLRLSHLTEVDVLLPMATREDLSGRGRLPKGVADFDTTSLTVRVVKGKIHEAELIEMNRKIQIASKREPYEPARKLLFGYLREIGNRGYLPG